MKKGSDVLDAYGKRGLIVGVHRNFYELPFMTMTPEEWLEAQEKPFTIEELYEPWYRVKLYEAGSIWSPESRLTPLS